MTVTAAISRLVAFVIFLLFSIDRATDLVLTYLSRSMDSSKYSGLPNNQQQ